jgi:ribosomal protein S18 acetylase RimI-like enzyme
MKLQKFENIDNYERLAKIIFTNFIDLQYQGGIEFSIDSINNTLTSPNLLGWFLIDSDNKVIGYMVGDKKRLDDGRRIYYISYFYIVESYRNTGLGKQMMINCINYVSSENIPFIILTTEVNSNAFKLYRNMGFVFDPIIKIQNPNFTALIYYCNNT